MGLSRWMLLAALPWAGALPSALADEPAYESMSLEELLQVPVVVTASRQDEAVTDAPATTVVITREEIRLRGYAFLKDVLRDPPGMETQQYFNSQIGTRVPVRGQLGNHKIIVLVNGMRVNPPGGENMMFRSDISVRDADQIEVVYGPGSTLYGQDAISAVINIITRQASTENTKVSKLDARDRFLTPMDMSRRLLTFGMEFGYPTQKEVWSAINLRFGDARLYGSVHYLDKSLTDLSSAYPDLWNSNATSAAPRGGEPTYLAGQIPTPWEMNAHILYSPIPSLDLYADFRNLTDHKYYLVASNTNSPTNSTSNGPYPIHHFREPVVCEWCSREDGVSC